MTSTPRSFRSWWRRRRVFGAVAALGLLGGGLAVEAASQGQGTQRIAPSPRRAAAEMTTRSHPSATSETALHVELASMLGSGIRSGRWGAMVVSLTRGDTLLAHNHGDLLTPASTMKLFTAALALERLGPDHHFSTDVLRDAPLEAGGVVNGNLYLRGDGDPAFSNRFLRGEPGVTLDLLARFVASAGVRHVRGDLVADASGFEERRIPEGWASRYLGFAYAAPVSALSLNENVVWVAVTPSGSSAEIALEPGSSVMTVRNAVRVAPGSRGGRITVRRAGDDMLEVRGWIGSRSMTRRYSVVISDPARFTAGAFRDALALHGVTVEGKIRMGTTPAGAERVAGFPSPPVARLLSVMNRESVNLFAELLYRNAARGVDRRGDGSADRAFTLLQRFMIDRVGADSGALIATDGSGLSTLNRVTPRAMIQLLDYAHRAPWASTFHASLPVAGESELLRSRMRGTAAHGNLHAKTGTLNAVISLAGYSTARNGEVLAFVFIYNGTDGWNARRTIDEMGATLAGFIRD